MEVRLDNLSKHFPGTKGKPVVKAVDKMDIVIPDGKLVGLLGPSGCGKSTTLYMIAGLHEPTEGKIWFGDRDVTEIPPENRGIGLVFQNYALYPHFTVRQNITFPLENVRPRLKKEEMEIVAQEIANLVDIGQLLDRKPKELSGGQQQRVAIARALAKRPQVLLLDEPLSNLDARLRLQTREEIRRIQRDTNVTTIFVTHDQEEAMSISDSIVVMRKGVVHQIDAPQVVYEEPVDLFVAKFLGSPAINIFAGEMSGGNVKLHGKVYAKGHKSKGKFDLTDERIYDVLVQDGYKLTKEHYFASIGVHYEAPEVEEVVEEVVEEEPKKLLEKVSDFFAKVKGVFTRKEKLPEVTFVELDEPLTWEYIFDVALAGGYYENFEHFQEEYGKILVADGVDREIKIGVRPEAFSLDPTDNPPISVEVKFIEHIGRDITIVGNVLGQTHGLRVIIPAEQRHRVKGDIIEVYPKRFYLFDADGSRLI